MGSGSQVPALAALAGTRPAARPAPLPASPGGGHGGRRRQRPRAAVPRGGSSAAALGAAAAAGGGSSALGPRAPGRGRRTRPLLCGAAGAAAAPGQFGGR